MTVKIINGQLLKEGHLVRSSILIEDGLITKIAPELKDEADKIIDAEGSLITAGLIDLHVHLREPGGEHKETIATGTMAAAKGGYTLLAAMPNTKPVPDSKGRLEDLNKLIEEDALVRVLPYGAITKDLQGQELTDVAELKEAGAFAITDDGVGIQEAGQMLEAMRNAAKLNMAVVAHCEDNSLINSGSFHEGSFSKANEIKGIPSVCESVHIARDVLLAEAADCHYHVCHISSKESVRLVRDAKAAGIKVTAEVTPHHLLLCEEDIPSLDSNYKMNPPLRGRDDLEALINGLLDGTIDFIATDHAPHAEDEKALGIDQAPFGIVGLETAFPLLYTYLVKKEVLSLQELIDLMTIKPADTFNLAYGKIEVGAVADLALIDLDKTKKIDPSSFASKGKNTPFAGWECSAWPVMTIVGGQVVWQEEAK